MTELGSMAKLNSIETLDAEALVSGQSVKWHIIKLNEGYLSARYSAVVASISDSEIMILGGCYGFESFLGDGYIFNTDSMKLG